VLGVFLHKTIVDNIFLGSTWATIVLLILKFQLAFFAIDFIRHAYNIYGDSLRLRVMDKLNKQIYAKAVSTDLRHFNNASFYDNYSWSISRFSGSCNSAKEMIFRFFANLLTIISMITIISILDAFLLIFVVISVVIKIVTNRIHVDISYKLQNESLFPIRVLRYVERIFYEPQNAADLKSNKSAEILLNKYDVASEKSIKTVLKYAMKNLLCAGVGSLNFVGFNFVVMIYLAFRIVNGDLSAGSFFALLQASLNLNNILSDFFNLFNDIRESSNYALRIRKFMDAESEIELDTTDKSQESFEELGVCSLSIDLKNVGFKYDDNQPCLHNINMSIAAGEKIAIVGENGAGKSTLVKLLLRLYDVNEGVILLNGKPIKSLDARELRRKIGVAFQRPLVYAMTIAENMQLYNKASEEELLNALRKVGLERILANASQGLHTELSKEFSDDGIVLSGGGEQKLGLSRILTDNFNLLILDEPSSALDPIAEYNLNNLLLKNDATTIIISHRLSSVKNVDRIYLLGNNTILENGTHDQLIRLNGIYADMFNKQAESYT